MYGQGLSFPPRLGDGGRVAWSSGPENIREAIRIILLTEPGERVMLPAFGGGLRRFLFEPNTPATRRLIQQQIERALAQWEPRVQVQAVRVEADAADEHTAVATIQYRLVANQAGDLLRIRISLGG
jgi:hypothetical protein